MKKVLLLLAVCLVTFSTCFSSVSKADNSTNTKELNKNDVEKINLDKVENLDSTLKKYNLTRDNILENNYKVKKDNVGFINAKNKKGKYYNFYLEGNKIEYYSTQSKLSNGNSNFKLYDIHDNYILDYEANKNGDIVKENTVVDNKNNPKATNETINKAAFKWACIFSSYTACIGVSLGAGAAGSMVSGPFGAATGFAGGAACRYIFQTAVEKFDSKDAACKVLS